MSDSGVLSLQWGVWVCILKEESLWSEWAEGTQ
jgi:hypothetical protein